MVFGGKDWGQVVYGRLLTVSFFLFAIINLINHLLYNGDGNYSYMVNVIVLSVGGVVLFITTRIKSTFMKVLQVVIFCLVSFNSIIANIATRTGSSIISFPGDSLILVMGSIYIAHIYGLLKNHTIVKLSIYMCLVFISVLFPYIYMVPSILGTGISFIIFAIVVIFIYWIGEGVKNKKNIDKIKHLEKSIDELRRLNCEMVDDRYHLVKRYESMIDENVYLKTALVETVFKGKMHE